MGRAACLQPLGATIGPAPADDIATSIIRFHEQVQGWLAYLNRNRKPEQIVAAYEKLEVMWRWFLKMNVTSFTAEAQACYSQIQRTSPRVKTLDLRIASIAITTESVLLTRNARDFRQVPGLRFEEWTL